MVVNLYRPIPDIVSVAGSGTAGLAARGTYYYRYCCVRFIHSFGKDRPSAYMTLVGSSKSDVELHSFHFHFSFLSPYIALVLRVVFMKTRGYAVRQ